MTSSNIATAQNRTFVDLIFKKEERKPFVARQGQQRANRRLTILTKKLCAPWKIIQTYQLLRPMDRAVAAWIRMQERRYGRALLRDRH